MSDPISKAVHEIRRYQGQILALEMLLGITSEQRQTMISDIETTMRRWWDNPNGPYMHTCDLCCKEAPSDETLNHSSDCTGVKLLAVLKGE